MDAGEHDGEPGRLRRILEDAAELLPAQGPIHIFVHHNPLHALSDRPFERAVVEASALYGTEPFLSEDRYRAELVAGRILERDLVAEIDEALGEGAAEVVAGIAPRRAIRLAVLRHGLRLVPGASLPWWLEETWALRRFRNDLGAEQRRTLGVPEARRLEAQALRRLWDTCLAAVKGPDEPPPPLPPAVRLRDLLVEATGADPDELVHPLLIRLTAAFLDQGIAQWALPERAGGLLHAFRLLYGRHGPGGEAWLSAVTEELALLAPPQTDAASIAVAALHALGVQQAEWHDCVVATLLALRGWAGMVHQMQVRPDRAPVQAPPAQLAEFLAVRLVLDVAAARHVARRELGHHGDLDALAARLRAERAAVPRSGRSERERAFVLFDAAQILGQPDGAVAALGSAAVAELLSELDAFGPLERRRLFHRAYERRHRVECLDALAAHVARPIPPPPPPRWQALFCIDEREESIRRHLEEVAPECETFGVAGFFGVAMYYRGVADGHLVPLCPVAVQPTHEISEAPEVGLEAQHARSARRRRALGHVAYGIHVGSRTLVRGTLLLAIAGLLAAVPLLLRVLFPRLAAALRRSTAMVTRPPQDTRLAIERAGEERTARGLLAGYAVPEMVDVVARVLEEVGLTRHFASVVAIIGHGSSSLNNPHESAHDCGACGGGRGGPNARVFAQMANDPRVRAGLAARGIAIPESTWFVGAMHDSCDDSLRLFDRDHVPGDRAADLESLWAALDEARERNAHERARRFESAPLWLSARAALAHVRARAQDLAQVRPEYGHASNAVAFVGRRIRTRGLFLDRRAFLVSYDPIRDEDGVVLERLLAAVLPVCAGINLEYWFSYVDPTGYGSGTKLPHNVTALLGVMDGHASDLRTGLPWQMVELHEPVRLLAVIEAPADRIAAVLSRRPELARLVEHGWIQLACLSPHGAELSWRGPHGFAPWSPEQRGIATVHTSLEWYRARRDHLPWARVVPAEAPPIPRTSWV